MLKALGFAILGGCVGAVAMWVFGTPEGKEWKTKLMAPKAEKTADHETT